MRINIVTFASRRYEPSMRRLLRSAKHFGDCRTWSFRLADFRKTTMYAMHRHVSTSARGAGLWLWKPYYIMEVLQQLQEGAVLIYLDAGFEIRAPLDPLVSVADSQGGAAFFKVHDRLNGHWTKRDCFVLMECDRPAWTETEQSASGIVVLRKNACSMSLVADWQRYLTDRRVVSDDPNTCGLPDYEGFQAHRHDQSVLNNLRVRYGLRAFADPSQYGEAYRSRATPGLDDYPTLLLLHRERLPSWRTALRLAVTSPDQFASGVAVHLRRMWRWLASGRDTG